MAVSSARGVAVSETTKLARQLHEAYGSGLPIAPIRDLLPPGDVAAAYQIQEANTRKWLKQGRRLVGRKIGLTSVAVQKQLGVDQPDFGMLFADMEVCDDEPIASGRVCQAKVEAEVAFVLDRDITVEQATMADVIRAIAYAVAAIEIVGSRIANWDIRLVDTVADNASSGLYVLGNTPMLLPGLDLRDCAMQMTHGSDVVSTGVGHACLGHPLNAVLWLARKMVEVGRPLKAGDTILSGALGPMVVVQPGDRFEAVIAGLGSVRARFAV
ncbi:fumarylacetoacetate hydrolase family protein [Nevskia sp.]|uniref:2-keto-4-pentenoate hydratase n=1 Tax=Nevskia sp. TaxID=1929292 RepID=UPI0025EE945E|nr:fumarylacetoacetate hydrolase family protein [Nevskia sp.]